MFGLAAPYPSEEANAPSTTGKCHLHTTNPQPHWCETSSGFRNSDYRRSASCPWERFPRTEDSWPFSVANTILLALIKSRPNLTTRVLATKISGLKSCFVCASPSSHFNHQHSIWGLDKLLRTMSMWMRVTSKYLILRTRLVPFRCLRELHERNVM